MKNRKHNGTALMLAGVILLAGAAVLTYFNIQRQTEAGDEALFLVKTLSGQIESQDAAITAADEAIPEESRPMPAFEIDGNMYVGVLQIPALGLELPIINDCTDANLQLAPCLYYGSVNTGDMVICGHNYSTHFGRLTELAIGDEIVFRDANGSIYTYVVADFETLMPTDVEYMTEGEWPLTLFTCTWGGRSRITLRCEIA